MIVFTVWMVHLTGSGWRSWTSVHWNIGFRVWAFAASVWQHGLHRWCRQRTFVSLKFYHQIIYINIPGVDSKKHPTSELLRRKMAGLPLEDDEDKNALPRGKNTWQGQTLSSLIQFSSSFLPKGIPRTELSSHGDAPKESASKKSLSGLAGRLDKGKTQDLTASVTTAKTTLGHSAVIEARNEAYKV